MSEYTVHFLDERGRHERQTSITCPDDASAINAADELRRAQGHRHGLQLWGGGHVIHTFGRIAAREHLGGRKARAPMRDRLRAVWQSV